MLLFFILVLFWALQSQKVLQIKDQYCADIYTLTIDNNNNIKLLNSSFTDWYKDIFVFSSATQGSCYDIQVQRKANKTIGNAIQLKFYSQNGDRYLFLIANGNPKQNTTIDQTIKQYVDLFNSYQKAGLYGYIQNKSFYLIQDKTLDYDSQLFSPSFCDPYQIIQNPMWFNCILEGSVSSDYFRNDFPLNWAFWICILLLIFYFIFYLFLKDKMKIHGLDINTLHPVYSIHKYGNQIQTKFMRMTMLFATNISALFFISIFCSFYVEQSLALQLTVGPLMALVYSQIIQTVLNIINDQYLNTYENYFKQDINEISHEQQLINWEHFEKESYQWNFTFYYVFFLLFVLHSIGISILMQNVSQIQHLWLFASWFIFGVLEHLVYYFLWILLARGFKASKRVLEHNGFYCRHNLYLKYKEYEKKHKSL